MKKYKLVIILILALALITTWFFFLLKNHTPNISLEEDPIITTNAFYILGGKSLTTYIYENRHIICIEEINLRLEIPGYPPTRIWKKGNISQEDTDELFSLFNTREFNELSDRNNFIGRLLADGSLGFSDMSYTITVNYENINRTIHADRYISDNDEKTYPDMPFPLNEIYKIVKQIADNQTQEVHRELIK